MSDKSTKPKSSKKFIKPRPVKCWVANINGDDMPHVPYHFDFMGLQEMHKDQISEIEARYHHRKLYTPYDKHYNLGILVHPGIFEVTSAKTYRAHPSGVAMHKDEKFNYRGKPFPLSLHTPTRGVFELLGNWYGDPTKPGFLRVGHRVNRGPLQPCRNWLGGLFDDVASARNKATKDRVGVEFYDYNQQDPKPLPHMNWVADHGTDHIGASLGVKTVGRQMTGPAAGHSGRVHHHSLGIVLDLTA